MKHSANSIKTLLPLDAPGLTDLLPNAANTTAGTGPSSSFGSSSSPSVRRASHRSKLKLKLSRAHSRSSSPPKSDSNRDTKASHKDTIANTPPASPRIVFGRGVLARLPAELGRLHLAAPFIVSSPSRADLTARVQAYIPNLDTRVLDPSFVERFSTRAADLNTIVPDMESRDCVVSIGGGSAVAVARMVSMHNAIPHICIPTTYSGNELMMEMPSSVPETKARRRRNRRESQASKAPNFKPVVIIYDEDLTASCSKIISAPSCSAANTTAHTSELNHQAKDANSLWSYIHLPGV